MSGTESSGSSTRLPRSDQAAELQRASVHALSAFLKDHSDKLVLRDERAEDAGVDASLELITDGYYTNFRSQLQLKGTDRSTCNADGTLSIRVSPANLNYLLSGPSPLYIAYLRPRDELRFAWAREERRRLDSTNPKWDQQKSITIRLGNLLTADALEGICDRIRAEAQMHRSIHDALATSTLGELVKVSIDPETLSTISPNEAYELLFMSGTAIVASGYPTSAMNLAKHLNPEQENEPGIQLVFAYAAFVCGEYHRALAHSAKAGIQIDRLAQPEQRFLGSIKDASELQLGIIDKEEFTKRADDAADSLQGVDLLVHRLNRLRDELFEHADPDRQHALIDELRQVVDQICASPDATDPHKVEARIVRLFVECNVYVLRFIRLCGITRMREAAGFVGSVDRVSDVNMLQGALTRWERDLADTQDAAERIRHPILVADAITTRIFGLVCHLAFIRQAALRSGAAVDQSMDVVEELKDDIQRAIVLYSTAGTLYAELRARVLLADVYVLLGELQNARAVGRDVLPKARALGYSNIARRARECTFGDFWIERLLADARPTASTDSDEIASTLTDEQVRSFAENIRDAFDIDSTRLPVIQRDIEASRFIARERLNWCQHIDLLQDLAHIHNPRTFYARDPERRCRCCIHEYETKIATPEAEALVDAFKQTYCESCPDRSPKGAKLD